MLRLCKTTGERWAWTLRNGEWWFLIPLLPVDLCLYFTLIPVLLYFLQLLSSFCSSFSSLETWDLPSQLSDCLFSQPPCPLSILVLGEPNFVSIQLSIFWTHMEDLQNRVLGPTCRVSGWEIWGGAWKFSFLSSSTACWCYSRDKTLRATALKGCLIQHCWVILYILRKPL